MLLVRSRCCYWVAKRITQYPELEGTHEDQGSLEAFRVRLDGALSNLVSLKMSLLMAEGLDAMIFKGPSQPKPFYDSMLSIFLSRGAAGKASVPKARCHVAPGSSASSPRHVWHPLRGRSSRPEKLGLNAAGRQEAGGGRELKKLTRSWHRYSEVELRTGPGLRARSLAGTLIHPSCHHPAPCRGRHVSRT